MHKAQIEIRGLKIYAYHGFFEAEQKIGQYYLVDVVLNLPTPLATENDQLNDTVNYSDLVNWIKEEMAIPSKLIEHVAGRIASKFEKQIKTQLTYSIAIHKLNPPVNAELNEVVFTLSGGIE